MNPLGFRARALELKAQRCFISVLVEVGDVELAAGLDASAGTDAELEDGAVAQIQ